MTLLLLLKSMLWTRLWYVAHRICLCPAHLCGVLNKTVISVLPLSVFPVPTRVPTHNRSLISRCWIDDSMFSYMCITGGSQSCMPWLYPPTHPSCWGRPMTRFLSSRFRASFCRHCREQTWSSGGADASPRVALCQWQTRVWGFSGANGDILPFLSGYKIGNLLRPHSVIRLSPLFWDNETKTQKGKGLCQLCLVILGHVHVNQLKTPTGFGPKESWWMHDA